MEWSIDELIKWNKGRHRMENKYLIAYVDLKKKIVPLHLIVVVFFVNFDLC